MLKGVDSVEVLAEPLIEVPFYGGANVRHHLPSLRLPQVEVHAQRLHELMSQLLYAAQWLWQQLSRLPQILVVLVEFHDEIGHRCANLVSCGAEDLVDVVNRIALSNHLALVVNF